MLVEEDFMIKEFKEFIARGNVIDLAVGVVMGTAFGKIVSSLVNDIIMPLVGIILGGIDFSSLTAKVGDANIAYGMFIQNIIDFLIISLCIFFFVKLVNKLANLKKKEEKKEKEPEVKVATEVEVLEVIRDLLKKKKEK